MTFGTTTTASSAPCSSCRSVSPPLPLCASLCATVCVCLAAPGGGRSPVAEKQCKPPSSPPLGVGSFRRRSPSCAPTVGRRSLVRHSEERIRCTENSLLSQGKCESKFVGKSLLHRWDSHETVDGMTFPRLSLESRCESQSGRQEDGSDEALRRSLVWRARPLQSCRSSALPDGRARSGTVVAT